MLRTTRTLVSSLAVFLVVGLMAPSAANALSLGKKTKSDASTVQGASITVQLFNRGQEPQVITMDGKTYTVQPHQSLTIKGTSGTSVYANTTGKGYQKGDLLFKFAPSINGGTIEFN